MRKKITFLSVLLVAALLLGMVPLGAFRSEAYAATAEPVEDENPLDVEGDKTASPTNLDPENLETTVTLQLPAGEYQNKVDIVFVMDNSTSVLDKGFDFASRAKNLLDNIVEHNQGIDLKVSVIKFRGYATDMLKTESNSGGLLDYEENASAISAAIANVNVPGSGSNMHSGLVMAEKFLSKDTEVDNDNKFVILLTDGKSYIWNNENDEPVMNYSQWFKNAGLQNNGRPYYNQSCGLYNKENKLANYHGLPYEGEVFSNFISYDVSSLEKNAYSSDYYGNLFSSTSEKLTGKTDYDVPAYYSKYYKNKDATALGDVETISSISNASEVFNNTYKLYRNFYQYTPTEGTEWENLKYYSINPYKLKKAEDGTWMFDVDNPDEDFYLLHPTTMEKGTYIAGHYWKETIAKKYNTATILVDPHKYSYNADKKEWSTFSQGMFLAGSFDYWLKENSDVSAFITDNGTNNMIEGGEVSEDKVGELFTDIDNSIRYMVSKGVVTDQITDDFTLKNADNADGFRMTLNGEALAVTYADGKWNFGEIGNDGKYPYVVSYDESKKTITWEINVPVENVKPVTLSYDLIISENAEAGEYDTNVSAILDYKSSDGKRDGTYTFEKPKVTYTNSFDVIYRYEGNVMPEDPPALPEKKSYKYGETVDIAADPEAPGYTFSGWSEKESFEMPNHEVVILGSWTIKGDLSYIVRYFDKETKNPVADSKQVDKQTFGTYVTESAIKVTGYLLDDDEQKSIQIQDGENLIVFLYKALKSSYIVNYLDESTKKPVANSKTVTDQQVGTVVTESAIKVNGYLLKSNETQSITIVEEAAENVINFYYGKETTPDKPDKPDKPDNPPTPDPTDEPEPIDNPDTPLAPPTDDETDIDDPDTPLAPGTVDEETEIDDEETPLSPFTGDNRHTGLWAGISAASLLGIALLGKRRRKSAK